MNDAEFERADEPNPLVTEVLKRVRDRLAKGWCQMSFARDRYGIPCERDDECATSWCLTGAIEMEAARTNLDAQEQICLTYVMEARAGRAIVGKRGMLPILPGWNDSVGRTQDEVLTVVDRAINLRWYPELYIEARLPTRERE